MFTKDDTVVKYTTEPSTGYNTMFLNGGGLTAADFTGYNVNPSLCISRVRGTETVGSTPTTGTLLLTSSQLSGQQHTLDGYSDSLKIFHSVYSNMRVGVFSMHGESSANIVTGFNFIHNPFTNSNGHGSVIIGSSAYVNNLYGVSNSTFDSGITILKGDALSVGVDSGGGVISTGQKLNIKSGAGLSLESGAGAFEFNTTGSGITVSYNKATTFNVTSGDLSLKSHSGKFNFKNDNIGVSSIDLVCNKSVILDVTGNLTLKSSTGKYYFDTAASDCTIDFNKGVIVNTPGDLSFFPLTGGVYFTSGTSTAITVGFNNNTTLNVSGDMNLKSSTGKYYFNTDASDCTIDFNKNVTVNTQGNLSFSPSTGGVYFNSGSSTAITVGFNKATTLKVSGDITVDYGSASWSKININSCATSTSFVTFNNAVNIKSRQYFIAETDNFVFRRTSHEDNNITVKFEYISDVQLQFNGDHGIISGNKIKIKADQIELYQNGVGGVTVEEIFNHIFG